MKSKKELNHLYVKEYNLDGDIFFENLDWAIKFKNSLEKLNVGYTTYVVIGKYFKIYGFKVCRAKKHMLQLYIELKEALR